MSHTCPKPYLRTSTIALRKVKNSTRQLGNYGTTRSLNNILYLRFAFYFHKPLSYSDKNAPNIRNLGNGIPPAVVFDSRTLPIFILPYIQKLEMRRFCSMYAGM